MMETVLDKKERMAELEDAISIINRVRVSLFQYYPKISSNPHYKANCNSDQDALTKAINKIQHVNSSISRTQK